MKNVYNLDLIELTARLITSRDSSFDTAGFVTLAADDLENRELKDRANQICLGFKQFLPKDYTTAVNLLLSVLAPVEDNQEIGDLSASEEGLAGWIIMPMTQYVGELGQGDLAFSMEALRLLTKRFSSEFGIRYFLIEQPEASLTILTNWLNDPCRHVRRLVSEGTRPLLPWAMQLPSFKEQPAQVIELLEHLKDDSSEYVRRSVANNLNDIAKHHPDLVSDIATQWLQDANKNRQRLVKHACRTLIKQGHSKTLAAFGYQSTDTLEVSLSLASDQIEFGSSQVLTCHITNPESTSHKILLDYVIYHHKANGKLAPKVFKWKELTLSAGESITLTKKHAFVPISTRKYYSGEHACSVQLNGTEQLPISFKLTIPT